jgi:hypothetical protein
MVAVRMYLEYYFEHSFADVAKQSQPLAGVMDEN